MSLDTETCKEIEEEEFVNPSRHPNKADMEQLWRSGKRARAIVDWLEERGLPQVRYETLARYGQRAWSGEVITERVTVTVDDDYGDIASLVQDISNSGSKVTKVVVDSKDSWGWEKQEDGSNEQVLRTTTSRKVEYVPAAEEEEFIIEPGFVPDITIGGPAKTRTSSKAPTSLAKNAGWKLAVSVPDMQVGGFLEHLGGSEWKVEPTHDEQAIQVAFEMIAHMENEHGIDLIVNAGDNLDFPGFSTHKSAPGYKSTTQYAIDRYTTIVATQRAICPEAEIVELPSNHVARLTNMIVERIPELVGIKRGNSKPEDEPLLSMAYLCRFDEYDVNYIDGWPDGEYWAAPNLRFVHGDATSSVPGGTARKYLREGISTLYGHSHHSELLYLTEHTSEGAVTSFAASGGHLARMDGFLPSAKTGITASGKLAAQRTEAWQQGIVFIWYKEDGSEEPIPEMVKISKGKAILNGKIFETTVDKYGEPL